MFSAGIIVGLIFYIIKKSTAQDLKYVERFQSNMFFLVLLPPIIFESGYSLHKVLDHCLLLYNFTLAFVGRFLPEYWLHFGVCCNRYRNISINCWRSNIWSWKGIVNKESCLCHCFNLVPGCRLILFLPSVPLKGVHHMLWFVCIAKMSCVALPLGH